ncbi:hypothetical protein XB02_04725 [Pantoea ananatis]|nr:hypothetical protein XB02_04725 [Pantoea ananatis]
MSTIVEEDHYVHFFGVMVKMYVDSEVLFVHLQKFIYCIIASLRIRLFVSFMLSVSSFLISMMRLA